MVVKTLLCADRGVSVCPSPVSPRKSCKRGWSGLIVVVDNKREDVGTGFLNSSSVTFSRNAELTE